MAQFIRPTSDISTTGWNSTGANFWSQIDESSPNDADYVYALTASTGTLEVKGNSISTPGTGTAILVVRWCDGWVSGLSTAWASDCEISLVEGTTVLHTFYDTPPHQATYADQTFDITAYPPGAYNDLRIRMKKGIGGDGMYVSQAYIQYPDASSSGTFVIGASAQTAGTKVFTAHESNQPHPQVILSLQDGFTVTGPFIYEYPNPYDPSDAYNGGICERTGWWAPAHCLVVDSDGLRCIAEFASQGPTGTVIRSQFK